MPSINEVMERVSMVKPSAIDEQVKAQWLLDLDGRMYHEVIKFDAPDMERPMRYPEDGDKELCIGVPYDKVYDLYLIAMIEFSMREFDEQNNTTELFNEALDAWRAAWRREHRPKGTQRVQAWR